MPALYYGSPIKSLKMKNITTLRFLELVMPIETKDLVIYESERLTDNDDGGGKYNGKVIVDGRSNNSFDDISELDRTMGSVSLRKIFPP